MKDLIEWGDLSKYSRRGGGIGHKHFSWLFNLVLINDTLIEYLFLNCNSNCCNINCLFFVLSLQDPTNVSKQRVVGGIPTHPTFSYYTLAIDFFA